MTTYLTPTSGGADGNNGEIWLKTMRKRSKTAGKRLKTGIGKLGVCLGCRDRTFESCHSDRRKSGCEKETTLNDKNTKKLLTIPTKKRIIKKESGGWPKITKKGDSIMENYNERCGMCVYCDLRDKDSWSGSFKCRENGYRVKVTEEKCRKFQNDSHRTFSDIEYARAHENGLS